MMLLNKELRLFFFLLSTFALIRHFETSIIAALKLKEKILPCSFPQTISSAEKIIYSTSAAPAPTRSPLLTRVYFENYVISSSSRCSVNSRSQLHNPGNNRAQPIGEKPTSVWTNEKL